MAEVNASQLQAAIARLGPVRVRISGSDDTTDAVILYPGTIAGRIASQLQAAIARLGPVRVRISGSDDTTDAVILYPGTIAGRILQAVAGLREHLEPDHAAEAAQALSASTYSYQKWGEGASGAYKAAMWELERAKVHALLAIAEAASATGRGSDG